MGATDTNNEPKPPPSVPKTRQRSSIACRTCNSRRVKCNVAVNGVPCANCEKAGVGNACQLIDSKRGRKRKSESDVSQTGPPPLKTYVTSEPSGTSSVGESPSSTARGCVTEGIPGPSVDKSEGGDDAKGPEMLYAQMLDTKTSPSTRRELLRPGGQVIYLGETFNLTYLLHQTSSEPQHAQKLHFAVPVDAASDSANKSRSVDGLAMELLRRQGAFELPSLEVCHGLYRTYFKCVQPHYPILDPQDFAARFVDVRNPPSWLLLQAVLFMAAGHCDLSVLKNAGFKSRSEARLTLFKRTKALYDADHELDKVTIVQALFLMSFWWATPMDQKDTWHWLGNAISLALTLGMHRSTRASDMTQRDQRLWKKIWWSLFAEDKHAAAALGRPVHIHLHDTDVEPLEESDFEDDSEPYGFGHQEKVHVLYAVHLTKLSTIVERIIEKQPYRSEGNLPTTNTLEICEDMLQQWETRLPQELQLGRSRECLWTSMLHVAFGWFKILTHRTRTSEDPSTPSRVSSHQVAMTASNQMARIVEDLLGSNSIQHCPIHIIPSLFAAMCMQALNLQSEDAVLQQLASVKLKLCMIALRELQSSWPVSGWIFLLFTKIVRRIHEQDETPTQHRSARRSSGASADALKQPAHESNAQPLNQPSTIPGTMHSNQLPQPIPSSSRVPTYQTSHLPGYIPWEPQDLLMPLNFSTDWSTVRDEDLWLVQNFDLGSSVPRMDHGASYMSGPNLQ